MPKPTFFNLEQDKQDKIINAAIFEFADSPFSKVTIDKIVNRADIPKGSFYQYFVNKEDLYKHLYRVLSGDKAGKLKAYLSMADGKRFSQFIRELLRQGIDYNFQDPKLLSINEKFMTNCTQELKDEILDLMIEDSNDMFQQILSKYSQTGELREGLNISLAAQILTTQTIYLSRNLIINSFESKQQVIDAMDEMISIIERGILEEKK